MKRVIALVVLACAACSSESSSLAEPMTTIINSDPNTGIALGVQTCSALMPDGSIRHLLPPAQGDCVETVAWLTRNWELDQTMPKHCREYTRDHLDHGHGWCWNTAHATWSAREEDGKCYLADQQAGCPRGGATWIGTIRWGDAPQPPIPDDVKDWPLDDDGNLKADAAK